MKLSIVLLSFTLAMIQVVLAQDDESAIFYSNTDISASSNENDDVLVVKTCADIDENYYNGTSKYNCCLKEGFMIMMGFNASNVVIDSSNIDFYSKWYDELDDSTLETVLVFNLENWDIIDMQSHSKDTEVDNNTIE